jgi:hypothetical protein
VNWIGTPAAIACLATMPAICERATDSPETEIDLLRRLADLQNRPIHLGEISCLCRGELNRNLLS